MPYAYQYGAAIVVTVVGAMLGVAVTSADALELSRQQVAIIGIILSGLTVAAGFLPRVTKYPHEDRIGED